MNPVGFEELTVEIHPMQFNSFCKSHENDASTQTVSVDTFDLSSYLVKRSGFLVGKTVAVDTSDLESHYEFYRYEQRAKISKTVSTDTHDLEYRMKPRMVSSVAIGTENLAVHIPSNYCTMHHDVSVTKNMTCSGGDHCPDVNNVFSSNYKINGEYHGSNCRKDLNRVQESVYIKNDFDFSLECNNFDQNAEKTPEVLHINSGFKTDIKDLKETRPLLAKRDLDLCSHKNQPLNVELNNDSDSDSGDGEDNDGHSNDSDVECSKDMSVRLEAVKRTGGEGALLRKGLKSEEEREEESEADSSVIERKFKCDICKATFTRKRRMMVHLQGHSVSFSCEDCNKVFLTYEQLQSHVQTHNGEETFKYVTCVKNLSEECNNTNNSGKKPFECKECNKGFRLDKQLKTHQCHHQQSESCDMCGKKFRSPTALYNHVRVSHKSDNVQPILNHVKTPFECLTCGKVFRCKSALHCHETVHTGERNFVCETCNKAFPTKASLKAHSSTHTGLKPFVCTTCGKAFAKNDSLKTHVRKHTGERPFRCDICGQSFDRNFTLKNHRVTHTGEKTHICPMCGKAFATRGALSTHERTRHNTNPDKPRKPYKRRVRDFEPCVCDVCGKVYSNQANLRIHKATHTGDKPFLCTICGQSFAKKYTLQCHTRKHTDERPFPCDICGLTFFRNHTLKTHKLRHTGERPHVCSLCGKSFIQSASLAYHIRNHDRPPKASPKGKKRKKKTKDMSPSANTIPEVIPVTHAVFGASPYDHHPMGSSKLHSEFSQHEVPME